MAECSRAKRELVAPFEVARITHSTPCNRRCKDVESSLLRLSSSSNICCLVFINQLLNGERLLLTIPFNKSEKIFVYSVALMLDL